MQSPDRDPSQPVIPTSNPVRQPIGETAARTPHNTSFDQSTGSAAGANTEVLGIAGVAVIAMALLAVGYNWRSENTAVASPGQPPVTQTTGAKPGAPAASTERMTAPAQNRANPADMANPPTQYNQGSGSATTPPPTNPLNTNPR